eukprot:scaffold7040_cov100-Skeletonema_dohrnii-CCMP3373.AAC.2
MSADKSGSGDSMMMCCCASCGVAEAGDVKLKNCTACYLVKYCSVKCQKDHRPKHKRACKKRSELRDEILFKQPESTHLGDCPICCIPLPLDLGKSSMMSCCSKVICKGCNYANQRREVEGRLKQKHSSLSRQLRPQTTTTYCTQTSLLLAPSSLMMTLNCARCGKPDAPSKCSKCKTTNYCNRDCQSLDWKRHKKEDCIITHKNTKKKKKPSAVWKYSAPFKQHSYWLSLGYGIDYADVMKVVYDQFIEAVNGMRKNQYASDVYINYPLDSQTDYTIIFHDEALLPHWREVALALEINSEKLKSEKTEEDKKSRAYDALFGAMSLPADMMEDPSQLDRIYNDLYSDGDGEMGLRCQFVADKVELRKEVLDIIGPPLLLCPFDSIRLENNRFDREGILFAIDLLKQNKSMVSLHLTGNTIETDDDFNLLSEVISNHPSLKELDLTRCAGPNITSVSFNSIFLASKGLKTLHLRGNDIATDGSSIIADCLATNPPLQELFLVGNALNDDDAELIAE